MGPIVFNLPIPLWWLREYMLCLIITIKSEVWTITHCLGLGHETMVSAVCLSFFFSGLHAHTITICFNRLFLFFKMPTIEYRFHVSQGHTCLLMNPPPTSPHPSPAHLRYILARFLTLLLSQASHSHQRLHVPVCYQARRIIIRSPHKGQWRGAVIFSLICAWINAWVNNREAGHLRCYRAHYDVTVMVFGLWHWVMTSRIMCLQDINQNVQNIFISYCE